MIPLNFSPKLADLHIPLFAAPMFLVSGADLVIECCLNGVVGSFPALNGRTHSDFINILDRIHATLNSESANRIVAPYAVNLIVHKSNPRLIEDLETCIEYKVPIVITSLGNPKEVIEKVHSYGGLVFSDVATLEHAKKVASLGVDGIICVCAGAGGHAGVLTPFVFVPAVREFFKGKIVVAGGISSGQTLCALQKLGGDYGYAGTCFIATKESLASSDYKQMLTQACASDIVYTPAVSGTPANFLKESLLANGYNLSEQSAHPPANFASEAKAWKTTWSAGQGVENIKDIPETRDLIKKFAEEFVNSCQ